MSDVKTPSQPKNPLHGLTLQVILEALLAHYGSFAELAKVVPYRCFVNDPTVKSSLKFLRQTPWARTEIEQLYLKNIKQKA
jgi:uncharacterized protein (DUF2132 family)